MAPTGLNKPAIRSQTFIIQKYIERPLLANQRKFDIRVWVALTHDLDVYFFREGYLRTSSQPYSMNAGPQTLSWQPSKSSGDKTDMNCTASS